jgi:ankyrin repeat protein
MKTAVQHFIKLLRLIKHVEFLIARGIDTSTKNESGQTTLHYAAGKGRAAIVQIPLENNAEVVAEDRERRKIVREAAGHEHESGPKILLEHIGKENEMERWASNYGSPQCSQ